LGLEDDDYERRPQRRRYEEPLHLKVRKQLLSVAESVRSILDTGDSFELMPSQPLRKTEEEISSLAKLVVDNYEDEEVKTQFLSLAIQLLVHPEVTCRV